jgi:uncharacterized membrane protein (DUF2068 family)
LILSERATEDENVWRKSFDGMGLASKPEGGRGEEMNDTKIGVLRLIAVFKLVKATSLILVGIGALKLIHRDSAETLDHWVSVLGLNPAGRHVERALEMAGSLPPHRLEELGVGSFVYAALFLTEGAGLWMGMRWAEWFTVVITSSLVPVEVYELVKHPTIAKVAVLGINVSVLVYLVVRIRRDRQE